MRFILFVLLTVFFLPTLYAQTLTGKVTDTSGTPITIANLLIKEADQPNTIREFVQVRNGSYTFTVKQTYQKLRIEAVAFSHAMDSIIIISPRKDSTYILNFALRIVEQDLKEVVVVGKKAAFEEKEDTVSYNVSAYRDGTERKIQDIIKKLPGVEVNEKSGEIKYKGKPVETVTLEGDNLFGSNYSLGTKNINVDMVEQVQAIDNYSENPLLKGIEEGGKVSLNLKLKKGKFDFSGNIDAGAGIAEAGKAVANVNGTLLGISKNYKSFGSVAYNNVGINHSPFDYFGGNIGVERAKEKNYFASKAIPESAFSSLLEDSRANVNKAWFGNHNAIFKINKRISIKNNLYFVCDDIFAYQLSKNINTIDNQTFTTTDERNTHKKPTQYRGDIELKYNTSKKSLLEYNFRISQENIQTPTQTRMNETDNFESRLQSRDFYLKQNALFTKKLQSKRALQVSLFHSTNHVPQTLTFNPSVLNPTLYHTDTQESEGRKSYAEAKATLLGVLKGGKYTISVGTSQETTPYTSALFSTLPAGNVGNLPTRNNLRYSQLNSYQLASYTKDYHKWRVSLAYSASRLYQKLETEKEVQTKESFIVEPSVSLRYTLTRVSFLSGRVSYNQNPLAQGNLFSQEVLVNNRTSITNTPNLNLQKRLAYSLVYFNNNLDKLFKMNMGVSYQQAMGNFFTNFLIKERTTQINYFFLPAQNENLNFNFLINQFISGLDVDVSFSSSYGISNYKNILNGSELRNNQSTNFNSELALKTAFDIPVNFHNTLSFAQNQSKNPNSGTFTNQLLTNASKILIKPAPAWFISFTSEYYVPNLQKKAESYWFLDALIRFSPNEKKYEFNFVVNNLLNKNTFQQVQTSDFGTNTFQSNLLPRYFMMVFSYSF